MIPFKMTSGGSGTQTVERDKSRPSRRRRVDEPTGEQICQNHLGIY